MGFEYENTLYAQSICPDEINHLDAGLPKLLQTQWGTDGQVFHMGGLGGLPFTGSTGFGAFAAHVPTDGNLFIVFAPHVGIGPGGEVGKYLRDGQSSLSTACGAAIGALSGCGGMTPEDLSVYLKVNFTTLDPTPFAQPCALLQIGWPTCGVCRQVAWCEGEQGY